MRRTPMRRRPKSTSYARRERDFGFMGWIKTQRCDVADRTEEPGWSPCEGVTEADHAGDIGVRGLGMKAADDTCVPLCTKHHRERTEYKGFFHGFLTFELREYMDSRIRHYQAMYAEHLRTSCAQNY
jgi:hypothetical protein